MGTRSYIALQIEEDEYSAAHFKQDESLGL